MCHLEGMNYVYVCLLRSGLQLIFSVSPNPIFSQQFAIRRTVGIPDGVMANSAGNVSSKQCFMSREERMIYCEYILQIV
jgi:hypothetical protein